MFWSNLLDIRGLNSLPAQAQIRAACLWRAPLCNICPVIRYQKLSRAAHKHCNGRLLPCAPCLVPNARWGNYQQPMVYHGSSQIPIHSSGYQRAVLLSSKREIYCYINCSARHHMVCVVDRPCLEKVPLNVAQREENQSTAHRLRLWRDFRERRNLQIRNSIRTFLENLATSSNVLWVPSALNRMISWPKLTS